MAKVYVLPRRREDGQWITLPPESGHRAQEWAVFVGSSIVTRQSTRAAAEQAAEQIRRRLQQPSYYGFGKRVDRVNRRPVLFASLTQQQFLNRKPD